MLTILHGNALDQLRHIPDRSIQCCVTSPPYWGLRDYGNAGQIGQEPTPEAYVEKLVSVFGEVKRALKDDATLFLNLGDSYFGGGRGGNPDDSPFRKQATNAGSLVKPPDWRGISGRGYGNGGKGFAGLKCRDCASGNPCDAHRDSWLNHISRTCDHPALAQAAELLLRIRANMEALPGHLATADSTRQLATVQSASVTLDSLQTSIRAVEPLLVSLVSMTGESSRQRLADFHLSHTLSACLLSLRSFFSCAQVCANNLGVISKTFDCSAGIASLCAELVNHSQCSAANCSLVFSFLEYIQAQSTRGQLKPKDLIGIPWRVAFALQADGWYLRSDIIWAKPNPMPESVIDRPTRSHEYIFLLTKSERYYYDADVIKEPAIGADRVRDDVIGGNKHNGGTTKHSDQSRFTQNGRKLTARLDGDLSESNHGSEISTSGMRNKRDVWTVTPASYPEAHFATFPPELILPCVLAGTKTGDVVLDPFFGSGTTGLVALENGRRCIGCELNPEYIALARQRCETTVGLAL